MNLLIVDDQKEVVNSLVSGIWWEKLEIENVFTAFSAKEAKGIINNNSVTILLSDIEMPEEDGLSLFRWVKEQDKAIECIFLTSHADFSYAREAIQLGGFDYILQPARFEEIEKVIRKVMVKVKQRQKMMELEKQQNYLQHQQEQLLEGVIDDIFECDEKRLEEIYKNISPMFSRQFTEGVFYPIDIQVMHWKANQEEWNVQLVKYVLRNVLQEILQEKPCELLISNLSNYNYIVMLYMNNDQFSLPFFQDKLRKTVDFFSDMMEFDIAVYIGGTLDQGKLEVVNKVQKAMENNIMEKVGVFSGEDSKDNENDIQELSIDQWSRQIDQGEALLVKEEIGRFLKKKDREGRLSLILMKGIHHNFTRAYYSVTEKRKLSANELFHEDFTYEDYMNAFKSYDGMMKAIDRCFDYLNACEDNVENMDAVEKAKRFIQTNINVNITRKEVASLVYLNEEYFSRLFKSRTGYAFKDYLTIEKMNYAKKLLISTNFSVSIIASKIGYDNFSYFSKAFKKQENMTPQEYRQMHKTN